MVQEFYVQQVRDAERKNLAVLDAPTTKADAEAWVMLIRERIQQSFGRFPGTYSTQRRVTANCRTRRVSH